MTARKEKLKHALNKCPEIKPLFHPAMASRFYQAVKDLRNGLNTEDSRSEASEHLRALVDKIALHLKAVRKNYLLIYMVISQEF